MSNNTLYNRRKRYSHLAAIATTTIRTSSAHLVRVVVGSSAASAVITVSSTDGTVSIIDGTVEGTYEFDLTLPSLTVEIAGGSADITVVYL